MAQNFRGGVGEEEEEEEEREEDLNSERHRRRNVILVKAGGNEADQSIEERKPTYLYAGGFSPGSAASSHNSKTCATRELGSLN